MDAGINKKRNINSAVVGLVLLASFLLHSFVNHAHADREDDEELAKKFAPILVLTENPTIGGEAVKYLILSRWKSWVLNLYPMYKLVQSRLRAAHIIGVQSYHLPPLFKTFFTELILAQTNLHSSLATSHNCLVAVCQMRLFPQAI